MTREEHLLLHAMEECAEVAQRCSKALRFGLAQVQPEQPLDNRARILEEFWDLLAVMDMLNLLIVDVVAMDRKKAKVEKYLLLAKECGTLDASPS